MNKFLSEKWKIILVASMVVFFSVISLLIFESTRAATVDLLGGNGSLDNTTEFNLWKHVKVTGGSYDNFQLDPNNNAIVNAGRIDVNKNRSSSSNFDQYITYRFTPTQNVSSATLNLRWLRRYTPSTSGSLSSSSITAEIYRISDNTSLQTITIDSTRSINENYIAVNGLQVNAQLLANNSYELRLRVSGYGRNVSYYFDEVVLNGVLANPPVLNSTTVVNDSTVNLVFDKALDKTTAEIISNYSISPLLNVKTATLQPDGVTVKLTTDPQTYGVNYTVIANNIKSTSGDQMTTPGTANFTGTDTTPPQLLSASTVDNTTVNLSFNEALDFTTISNLSNYTLDNGLTVSSATLLTDNKTIQLKTSSQSNSLYTISVKNIKDTHNNTIGSVNNTASFNGTAPGDATPPTVVSSTVLNETSVDVKFSEAVDSISAQNAANYSIIPTLAVTNAVLQPDGTTVRLTTGTQVSGTLYTITINNVTDIAGSPVAAGTTTGFTGVDSTPPTVVSSTAVDNVTVDVVFNESLDSVTAKDILNYKISPTLIINSAVLQIDGKTVRLSTSAQVAGTAYNVTVTGVKDLANNTIGVDNKATFTGMGSDGTPPTTASVTAPDNQSIIVVYSETVDPLTSQNTANYSVSPTLAVNSAVLQSDGMTVDLTTATQTPNTNYSLTINNVQDTSGNVISSTSTTTFTGSSAAPVSTPHENFTTDSDKCAACHNSHASVGSKLTVRSMQTTLCYLCHDAGGQSKYNVAAEYGKPTPRTSHHKISEGTQNCTDCHNPHGVKDSNGNRVPAMLQLKTQSGVNGGNSFCLGCHQSAMGPTKAINSTYYPADGIGHNSSSLSPASGTNIRCEGCHEKHSSDLVKLLKKDPNKDSVTATGDDKSFCTDCHTNNSADNRYLGKSVFNNATYSKHNSVTSSNTNATFPGVTGQAGQCQNCHDPHGTAYGTSKVGMKTLRASYEDGVSNYTANNFTLCFQCHNSSSANNKYDVQTQYTDNGTDKGGHYIKTAGGKLTAGSKIPCEDCHSIHGSANNNKYMMNDSLGTNLGDGRNECMACHNAGKVVEGLTMVSLPTSVPQHTDNTTACLDCHGSPHKPSPGISNGGLDCLGCHSTIATAMKSTTSGYHHLMVNTSSTYATTQTNKNCLSCHVDHNKFNTNSQKAFNLKQNFTQSFATSDTTTTGAANTDFNATDTTNGGICLSCHKNAQNKTYNQPLGTTQTPAIGVNTFTNATAHNYSVQSTYRDGSTFDAVCTKCHNDTMTKDKQNSTNKFGLHDSSYQSVLTPFADSAMTNPMNEKFCFKCHDGAGTTDLYGKTMSTAAKGVYTTFAATTGSKHDLTTVTCNNCHDPHAANTTNPKTSISAPLASGILANVLGVSPVYNTTAWTAPTSFTSAIVTNEYQLCLKCHSNNNPSMPTTTQEGTAMTNVAIDFSPNNVSYHNIGLNGAVSKASGKGTYTNGFTATSTLYCSSCHGAANSPVTQPGDIHGSANSYILKYPYSPTMGYSTSNLLCYQCHSRSTYGGGGSGSGFSYHNYDKHFTNGQLVCANCHSAVPHGSNRPHLIVTKSDPAPYSSNTLLTNFYDPGSGQSYQKSSCGSNDSRCSDHRGY